MGCAQGLPTASDLDLDWVTEYTELTHDQDTNQNKTLCQNNPKKNFTVLNFGNKNSVHQMENPKRFWASSPILNAFARSAQHAGP